MFQEEAENERMHLMTFLQMRQPGPIFRISVIMTQWIFTALFSVAYSVSPKFCHRFDDPTSQTIKPNRCKARF